MYAVGCIRDSTAERLLPDARQVDYLLLRHFCTLFFIYGGGNMRNWTREAIIEVLKEVYKKWVKEK